MNPKNIFVTGDIALDYFIVSGERAYYDSKESRGTKINERKGGAALSYSFLSSFKKIKGSGIESVEFGFNEKIFKNLPDRFKSYSVITPGGIKKDKTWRVSKLLGFGSLSDSFEYPDSRKYAEGANILVLDDASMDYGSFINRKIWPPFLENPKLKNNPKPELIIYKMSGHAGKGELWKTLINYYASKLITIVSIHDLRKQDVKVSKGISWEQTALDLVFEMKNNKAISELLESRFLIITFDTDGALFICKKGKNVFEYQLIFDPAYMESEWEARQPGFIIGKMACFTSVFTAKLNLSKPGKNFQIEDAIKAGLTGVRQFHTTAYLETAKNEFNIPFDKIGEVLTQDTFNYSSAYIPQDPASRDYLDMNWSILLNNYDDIDKPQNLYHIARRTVIHGKEELANVPFCHFNKLFTADRFEIESLRNIKNLFDNYDQHNEGDKPLSIGIFGPPGAGKSFAVKQIGKSVLGDDVPLLEFNLSQFDNPDELIGAFHQVRDKVLESKKPPVVFWDEFDSKEYKWLQYLLAPMQDGKFQEGQITHPIGKCIFIFAGGTSYTMECFGPVEPVDPASCKDELSTEEQKKYNDAFYQAEIVKYKLEQQNFLLKKGPDFKSRLHGYLNVLGPNQKQCYDKLRRIWKNDEKDICFPVRRALFIRTILEYYKDEELDMDWGLINAFLKIENYKFGARSLEQIIIQLKGNCIGPKLLRSHLPANHILSLYIKEKEFLDLVNENIEFLKQSDTIAPEIHLVWMFAAETKLPAYRKAFQFLPVYIKASNYAAAERIPVVLAEAGLMVVGKTYPEIIKSEDGYHNILNKKGKGKHTNKKNLELMAEKEHELWKKFYEDNKWTYNKVRNDYKKQHHCLLDYNKLPEEEKDKDREQVKMYFNILNNAGFAIAFEK